MLAQRKIGNIYLYFSKKNLCKIVLPVNPNPDIILNTLHSNFSRPSKIN